MRRAGGKPRGFTLFELVVCILVISALATVLLQRLAYYQEAAEKAAMESTARAVKTGLQIQLAQFIIANRQLQAGVLEQADPFQWLERKPGNYGGLFREPLQPGNWYFDAQEKQLVYVVATGNRLELDGRPGEKQLRFRARLLKDRIRIAGGQVESVTGVTLLPVVPYRWPQGSQ